MADWGQEEDRATWFDLAQEIRQRHERCLGPQPMLVSERDGYVPPHVFFFRTVTEVYTVPYPIDHRAAVLELLVVLARERGAFAIGTVFQGVSPEKEGGKIHLRPTILSSLRGVRWCVGSVRIPQGQSGRQNWAAATCCEDRGRRRFRYGQGDHDLIFAPRSPRRVRAERRPPAYDGRTSRARWSRRA